MTRPLQIFAKRLRELRKEMSLRQEDIAKDLNVSRQTISKYERGVREPDFCMLIKLADYYKVSIDFLFGRVQGKKLLYSNLSSGKMDLHSKVAEKGDWEK
ncbi:MAG: helix-turn-helix transcriptional regulator [Fastidiosipila sp.]|nr:helix-turn-helix transcriptional regulator [Fastidiosipila sp.]